jgi:hypothetical protein
MSNLTRASNELFRRAPDERFETLADLWKHCQAEKERSVDRWIPPNNFGTRPVDTNRLLLTLGNDGAFEMNDWSFGQLCKFAGVTKETVNRLTSDTACKVFLDTLPGGTKPLQIFTEGERVRSIHGTSYTRLHNADLVTMLREFATDFQPPQKGMNGGTGLYCGEQDMFVFLIDPTGWTEIENEAFAPGFFVWNSEVGRRSLGIQTFWFQACCQNHIVWDAVEVVDFSRKHTGNVHEAFTEIRRIIESLVQKRDQRKDGFVKVIRRAMEATLGKDAEEVLGYLSKSGISRSLAKRAVEIAQGKGRFTVFSVVDALTRIAGEMKNAGDRIAADEHAAQLLSSSPAASPLWDLKPVQV